MPGSSSAEMAIWARSSRELTYECPGGMGNFCKYFGGRRGSGDIGGGGGGDCSTAEQRTENDATLTVREKKKTFRKQHLKAIFFRM